MKKALPALAILAALNLSPSAQADNTRYGIAGTLANLTVDDPDGATESVATTYFSGVMTMPVNRNSPSLRYWYELRYRSFDLEHTEQSIGQSVKSLELSATLQKAWPGETVGAFWVGAGAGLSFDDYTKRYTVAADGFVNQRYDDRSATGIGVLLNTGFNFKKSQDGYFVGLNFNYHMPIDHGINGVGLTAFVMW